ncbi:LytTR family DNA-binding domain-containing protein [Ammoniphilus sp. CFH 90114]|uniref:LytR/AlgR family response regulator transcription factor n=1 Tax=Ammoniphilus sp. CFH 90114 TaxID=2493665 RepID=UPI00100EA9F3|nr:LytTR family DNA-binding domain-containing protein [Ammoniphilus sp. CFH 90114]RXT08766.1 response regulator transcription factor [Ammoniphilus sp. CFH 90114]
MKIRAMIAEDERLAREELKYLLEQEEVEVLPSATNGLELLKLVEEHEPDVVFLDIHMPEMQGLQAARMLSSRKKCPLIVFSTAHEDYAVEAFDLDAVDYLLKPYDHHRLKQTLQRIRNRFRETDAHENAPVSAQASTKVSKLLVDDGERLIVLDPETILYASREERVIEIHTKTQVYTSKMTLQQMEEKLNSYSFYRTHRSFLVNMNYVLELIPWFNGTYNLVLNDGKRTQIPVSRSSAKELLQRLQR